MSGRDCENVIMSAMFTNDLYMHVYSKVLQLAGFVIIIEKLHGKTISFKINILFRNSDVFN